jgi:signal transduction histidine kinase
VLPRGAAETASPRRVAVPSVEREGGDGVRPHRLVPHRPGPTPRSRRLAWHLGLLCASLLVPVVALEAFLLFRIATTERAGHEAVARDAARRIAVSLDRGLVTLGAVAEVLATSDHLLADDLGAFRLRLQQLPRISEAGIVLRAADGRIILAEGAMGAGERDLAAEAAARATGRPQFSRLMPGAEGGARGFAVIVPVPDNTTDRSREAGRTLALRVPVAELRRLLDREAVPAGMTATITDRTGTVLARTRDEERHVGTRSGGARPPEEQEGWRHAVDADGTAVVVAHARSEVAGWTAWVFLPERAFAAPLHRSLRAAVVLGVLFAGLSAILAIFFARRIARPISALAQAVKAGDEAVAATAVTEVNALAEAHAAARAEAQRLRDAQAELRRVARLNEMGALAAALAHEINQPLTAAATFAEGALRLLADAPDQPRLAAAREAMREASEQAVHAGRIVRRLRDFLGGSDGVRLPTDVNRLVRDAVSLALADARQRGIALELALDADLPVLALDRVQIGQVVVNLVRNAVEAMGQAEPRELVVATRRVAPRLVEVSVADTGPGLDPEMRHRIFTPFVTTKPGGMGVGLSISRGIVEEHGGRLDWAPNPGGGALFRFTLRVAVEMPAGRKVAAHAG